MGLPNVTGPSSAGRAQQGPRLTSTLLASRNETPCFFWFARFFVRSQTTFTNPVSHSLSRSTLTHRPHESARAPVQYVVLPASVLSMAPRTGRRSTRQSHRETPRPRLGPPPLDVRGEAFSGSGAGSALHDRKGAR
jgi:hypothetical protein